MPSAPECDAQGTLQSARSINLRRQRDMTVLRLFEFPIHREIVHQVLPAIAVANVADGAPREIRLAPEQHADVFALPLEELPATQSAPPRRVVLARAFQVWGEQRAYRRSLPRSFGFRI